MTKQCSNPEPVFRVFPYTGVLVFGNSGNTSRKKELLKLPQSTILLSLNTTYTWIPFFRWCSQKYSLRQIDKWLLNETARKWGRFEGSENYRNYIWMRHGFSSSLLGRTLTLPNQMGGLPACQRASQPPCRLSARLNDCLRRKTKQR